MADIQYLFTGITAKEPKSYQELAQELERIRVLAKRDKRSIAQASFKRKIQKIETQMAQLKETAVKKYSAKYAKFTKVSQVVEDCPQCYQDPDGLIQNEDDYVSTVKDNVGYGHGGKINDLFFDRETGEIKPHIEMWLKDSYRDGDSPEDAIEKIIDGARADHESNYFGAGHDTGHYEMDGPDEIFREF